MGLDAEDRGFRAVGDYFVFGPCNGQLMLRVLVGNRLAFDYIAPSYVCPPRAPQEMLIVPARQMPCELLATHQLQAERKRVVLAEVRKWGTSIPEADANRPFAVGPELPFQAECRPCPPCSGKKRGKSRGTPRFRHIAECIEVCHTNRQRSQGYRETELPSASR